jgi:hypothetical protein
LQKENCIHVVLIKQVLFILSIEIQLQRSKLAFHSPKHMSLPRGAGQFLD